MFHIVLFEPEIPPNTGNLIRLCANTGFALHLIEPLGFSLSEKAFRRAGLDYHEAANLQVHGNVEECLAALLSKGGQLYTCSTRASSNYAEIAFKPNDILMFGPETRGLPDSVLFDERVSSAIKIPMKATSRSLNLSNAVAIIAFEAWRQNGFKAET